MHVCCRLEAVGRSGKASLEILASEVAAFEKAVDQQVAELFNR